MPKETARNRAASEGAPIHSPYQYAKQFRRTSHMQQLKWQQQDSVNLTTCDHSTNPCSMKTFP